MSESRPLRIAVIAGEESGDQLGANLISALTLQSGRPIELMGVGGNHLTSLGLDSLFDAQDINIMGFSEVVRQLPKLLRLINQTAKSIAGSNPDCLITIDSPDFCLRVARKVRQLNPSIPIIHYVCPTVWAWRPERAKAMRPYVDLVLCLFPFEEAELKRLDGPEGVFVGHRLASNKHILNTAQIQLETKTENPVKKLLLLPGSRRSEVKRLMEVFAETVSHLERQGHKFTLQLPTVPHVAVEVEKAVASWQIKPEIILDEEQKWQAFAQADAALACSGTVGLELALTRVPYISVYRLDALTRILMSFLYKSWSASLPNLIGGWPMVPEFYNQYVRPEALARLLPQLWNDTPLRASQREGFATVAKNLAPETPAGELAAAAILKKITKQN